jgi:hypothetical protein
MLPVAIPKKHGNKNGSGQGLTPVFSGPEVKIPEKLSLFHGSPVNIGNRPKVSLFSAASVIQKGPVYLFDFTLGGWDALKLLPNWVSVGLQFLKLHVRGP